MQTNTDLHPFIDEACLRWTRNFIAKQLWRFHGEYDAGDLLSEAWLVLDRITKRYGDVAIKQLMGLYKRSLMNHFHRMAAQNQYRENLCDIDCASGEETPNDSIMTLLVESPPEVRDAIVVLLEADPDLLADQPSKTSARRETYNERFQRIIDDAPKDIATKIRDFLRHGEYVSDEHTARIRHA